MDAQQKLLNKFLAELEASATSLIKQEASAKSALIQLEARKQYLDEQIAVTETNLSKQKGICDDRVAVSTEKIAEVEHLFLLKGQELATIQGKILDAEKRLEVAVTRAEVEQIKLTKSTQSLQNDITKLLENKRIVEAELATVQTEITDSKEVARVLDTQITKRSAEVNAEIAIIEADKTVAEQKRTKAVDALADKQDELEIANTKLVTLQSTISSVETSKVDFEEYKHRSEEALKAREQSLLERERTLAAAELRASRRGILDKV